MSVMCVHNWKYRKRPIRGDDGHIWDMEERVCEHCRRVEIKAAPNYAKVYAPEFQPWSP